MGQIKFMIILGLAVLQTACATATRGTHEVVKIASEPEGARAISNLPSKSKAAIGGYYGCEPTPCGINFPRKSDPVVEVSKDGYQSLKFKLTSAVATSATSVPEGTIIAGLPPGSHAVAGSPEFLKRIPVGGMVVTGGVLSLGAGAVLDIATGANNSLSPNPVTVFLMPEETSKTDSE